MVGAAERLWRRFRPLLAAGGPALRRPLGAQLGDRRFHRSRRPDRACASISGADGVGLNPLHALFDDRPGDCSPYSPNSRLFLNALYIDVEKFPEFHPTPRPRDALAQAEGRRRRRLCRRRRAEMAGAALGIRRLQGRCDSRAQAGFRKIPRRARRRCCRASPASRCSGTNSTSRGGNGRSSGGSRTTPDAPRLRKGADAAEIEFVEFVQWTADRQLRPCQDLAHRLGMKVGLYLDVAVGVQSDGFDAWNEQAAISRHLGVGAPPDPLNTAGQNWGLAGFNAAGLEHAVLRAVSAKCCGPRCATPARSGSITCWG